MADLLQRGPSLLGRALLALGAACALAAPGEAAERAPFVDAVLAEVDRGVVTASDIALARGLGLFGFRAAEAPIGAADVARFVDARLVESEADRLGIRGSAEEAEAAWELAAARVGGPPALAAWLAASGIEEAWARAMVEADQRWRRFIALRFQSFAFVSEAEVDKALGVGPHTDEARGRAREALRAEAVRRALARWLEEARARAQIRRVVEGPAGVPNPFPMPPRAARGADTAEP